MPISLPKIDVPTYKLKIPSTKKVVEYRPYLVSEEKILMLALESENSDQILNAIKKIVLNCTFEKVEVDNLTSFDLEYIFIQLRSKSVGEIVQLSAKCQKCGKKNEIETNLNDVEVVWPEEKIDEKIMVTETIGVEMRYPRVIDSIINSDGKMSEIDEGMLVIAKCVKSIFDDKNVYPSEDYKTSEIVEFLESLNHKQLEKITNYVSSIPKLISKIEYKCVHCGHQNEIVVEGIQNFFT